MLQGESVIIQHQALAHDIAEHLQVVRTGSRGLQGAAVKISDIGRRRGAIGADLRGLDQTAVQIQIRIAPVFSPSHRLPLLSTWPPFTYR